MNTHSRISNTQLIRLYFILQEMKADLDRSLKIRVDSDKNANEVAKDIVERSVKAANECN